MELKLKIYKNKNLVNELNSSGEDAYKELASVLMNKVDKRCNIRITKDSVYREIKVKLSFVASGFEMKDKYVYDYLFTNVDDRKINLY